MPRPCPSRTPRSTWSPASTRCTTSRTRVAHRIHSVLRGSEVLQDPILHRNGTSQLTLLEDSAFTSGMARIREAIGGTGQPAQFTTDIALPVTRGFVPRRGP